MGRRVFISYSHRNYDEAKRLHVDLQARGYDVWFDEKIPGSQPWRPEIQTALDRATDLVVLLSPESIASQWVGQEVTIARAQKKLVHPLLLKAYPEENLPLWMSELREIQHYDLSAEPYDAVLEKLCEALTPPNPLQRILDEGVDIHAETGALLSEDMLRKVEAALPDLRVDAQAEKLIAASRQAHQRRWGYFVLGPLLGAALTVAPFLGAGKSYGVLPLGETMLNLDLIFYGALVLIGGGGGFVYVFGRNAFLRRASRRWVRFLYSGVFLMLAFWFIAFFFSILVANIKIIYLSLGSLGVFFLGVAIEFWLTSKKS